MKSLPRLLTVLAALVLCAPLARAALPTPDPDNGAIILPPGFRAVVFADNLVVGRKIGNSGDRLRFITVAPNGDVYAKSFREGLFALRDSDGDGRADIVKTFGTGDGTGVALHDGWLYYSTTTGVYRYKYTPGELVPSGEPQTIVSGLPANRQHDAKSFAFDGEGRLLVEVGSPSNSLGKPDRQRGAKGLTDAEVADFLSTHGGFWRFDPNKLNQTQADGFHFSTGHRHSLALAWNPVSQNFFMAMMGRDNLNVVDPEHYDELDNAERVAEEFHLLKEGINLGWPRSYWDPIKKTRMVSPEYGGDNLKRAAPAGYDEPLIAFPGHWAPLQMAYYGATQFPAKYRGGMFMTFHGSWNRAPRSQAGYKVVFVPFDEKGLPRGGYETFADDFAGREDFTNPGDARFRPGGIAVGPDGSLYVAETEKGRIWRIFYTGETASAATSRGAAIASSVVTSAPVSAKNPHGRELYQSTCMACHLAEGTGVASLNAPLAGSRVVAGDSGLLIKVVLRGPAAVLPADRAKYSNVMPPLADPDDRNVADLLSYVREVFGAGASAVTPAQVAALRQP